MEMIKEAMGDRLAEKKASPPRVTRRNARDADLDDESTSEPTKRRRDEVAIPSHTTVSPIRLKHNQKGEACGFEIVQHVARREESHVTRLQSADGRQFSQKQQHQSETTHVPSYASTMRGQYSSDSG